jgi:hypothetical protein
MFSKRPNGMVRVNAATAVIVVKGHVTLRLTSDKYVRLVKMPLHCASHSRSRVISTSETLSGNGNWLAVVTNLQGSKCNIETVDGQYVLLTWVTCAAKQVGKNRV